jgi:ribosomal protein S6
MQVARKVSILVALGLGFGAAMAGEIAGSTVLSTGNVNTSVGFLATARQNIGVAEQNGKITNSTVIASGTTNTAAGFLSTANQSVGRASQNGTITNSVVVGTALNNTAGGFLSTATQEVGFAKDNGKVEKVDVWGKRRLAYPINKKEEGVYAVVNVECESATVLEVDRVLSLNDSVLRTKVLRTDA